MQARIFGSFPLGMLLRMRKIADGFDLQFHRFPVIAVTFFFEIEKSIVGENILVFDFVPFVAIEKMILFMEKRYSDIPDTD